MEYEQRFERIEAVLETMANGLADLSVYTRANIGSLSSTQALVLNHLKEQDSRSDALARSTRELIEVQRANFDEVKGILTILTKAQVAAEVKIGQLADSHARLAEEQARTEIAMQETQGKLDAVIHMWDDWIRERKRRSNGEGKTEPPPS